eukprot:1419858-Rhodomonas_salina.2
MKDSLLCLNAGARLRVDVDATPGTQWALQADALGSYMAELRAAILQNVTDTVAARFGSLASGCFTEAQWDRDVCFHPSNKHCALFLAQNASGVEAEGGFDFDVRKPEFRKFFKLGKWVPQASVVNLDYVVEQLVSSYEFVDADFDALLDGQLRWSAQRGWEYPLFRLRNEPHITDAFDDIADTVEESTFVRHTDHTIETAPPTRRCVFDKGRAQAQGVRATVHPLAQGADELTHTRPLVILRDGEPGGYADVTTFDVCSSDEMERYTARVDMHSMQTQSFPKMSCAFHTSPSAMGADYCDTFGSVTGCYAKMRVVGLLQNFPPGVRLDSDSNTVVESSTGRRSVLERQALQATLQCGTPSRAVDYDASTYWGLLPQYNPSEAYANSRGPPSAALAPNMRCSQSPYHDACVDAGLSQSGYPGNYATQGAYDKFLIPAKRPLPRAGVTEPECAWFGDGFMCVRDDLQNMFFRTYENALTSITDMLDVLSMGWT